MTAPTPVIYTIEGEIGAGKTELAKALAAALEARGLRVGLVLEPVAAWKEAGILQAFYRDPARHAYGFQTFVFATRILAIHAELRRQPAADLYLLERSPVTDPIFMELQRGDVSPLEMRMYAAWCDAWRASFPVDFAQVKALYLQTSLATCMARLTSRGREGEIAAAAAAGPAEAAQVRPASAAGGVTFEYQARLRRAHEAFFLGRGREEFPHMPVCPLAEVIPVPPALADQNWKDAGPERARVVADILELMGLATPRSPGAIEGDADADEGDADEGDADEGDADEGDADGGAVGNGAVGNGAVGNGAVGNGAVGNGAVGNGAVWDVEAWEWAWKTAYEDEDAISVGDSDSEASSGDGRDTDRERGGDGASDGAAGPLLRRAPPCGPPRLWTAKPPRAPALAKRCRAAAARVVPASAGVGAPSAQSAIFGRDNMLAPPLPDPPRGGPAAGQTGVAPAEPA